MTKQNSGAQMDAARKDRGEVRLDKWLQVARIYKTRSQAGEALDAGHVKLDGRRAKAGHVVKLGEEIQVTKGPRKLILKVKGIAARPLPAAEARELVEISEEVDRQLDLSPEQIESLKVMRAMDRAAQGSRKGRPTKKERREIDKRRS